MSSWWGTSSEPWFKKLEKVQDWLPSRRPRYRHTRTREIVRLDRATREQIWITKSCGKQQVLSTRDFEKSYKPL